MLMAMFDSLNIGLRKDIEEHKNMKTEYEACEPVVSVCRVTSLTTESGVGRHPLGETPVPATGTSFNEIRRPT